MKSFSEEYLNKMRITPQLLNLTNALSEYKGKEALYARQSPDVLERLVELAKIESVESSNRIEGINVKHGRIVDIVEKQSTPRNRSEEEVAGYRDALAYIHENYKAVPVAQHQICSQFLYNIPTKLEGSLSGGII